MKNTLIKVGYIGCSIIKFILPILLLVGIIVFVLIAATGEAQQNGCDTGLECLPVNIRIFLGVMVILLILSCVGIYRRIKQINQIADADLSTTEKLGWLSMLSTKGGSTLRFLKEKEIEKEEKGK